MFSGESEHNKFISENCEKFLVIVIELSYNLEELAIVEYLVKD